MRDKWVSLIAIAFLAVSFGGMWFVVSKLEKIDANLQILVKPLPQIPSRVDLNLQRLPMTVSAHVTFSAMGHSQTYTITGPSSADVDAEVARTRARLATEWGISTNDVSVTYLTN